MSKKKSAPECAPPLICQRCGGQFAPCARRGTADRKRKFCSHQCYRDAARLRKEGKVKACEVCKKQFLPRTNNLRRATTQRTCSIACASVLGRHWTEAEDSQLKQLCAEGKTRKEAAAILGRSVESIRNRIGRREMSTSLRLWSDAEHSAVLSMTHVSQCAAVASALGRSVKAVRERYYLLSKPNRPASHIPAASLAVILGVTPALIHEWIERAKILEAVKRPDGWHVAPKAVREMVRKDPDLIDLRRVNKRAFLNLLLDPRLA